MADSHDFGDRPSICAKVNHGILNITVVYCPHELRHIVYATHTDDQGRELGHWQHALGPFDASEEVIASVAHEALRWLGIEHDRRHQHRE